MILVNLNDLEFTFRKSNHLFFNILYDLPKKASSLLQSRWRLHFFDLCQRFYFSFRSTLS